MLYKEDWEEAQERLTAWWDRQVIDRPAMWVTAPRKIPDERPQWDAWDFSRYPDEPLRVIEKFEAWSADTYFGGEAFPNLWINLGAGVAAAFLGAKPVFYSDTVWFETPREWEDLKDLRMDPGNVWWQRAKRNTALGVERGAGKLFVAMTDLGGILDIAHSLRGKKRLMIDLFRNPGKVKDLCWRILETWHQCYEELNSIVQGKMKGSSAWMGIWCRQRWYPLQCDYAYMLSPSKFREFVLPLVEEQCRRLDHTVYHLDGYGQIPHLDMLLGIPELDAIQWVPGAGKPGCGSEVHFRLYRKIRKAGKGLVLGVDHNRIQPICKELGAEGILFQTSCRTPGQAADLLADSWKWI